MAGLPPLLSQVSTAAPAAGLRAARTSLTPFKYDENPRSLLTQVTGPLIGAVGAVGNLLDLPGSMIRDTLALKNPFDQIYNGPSSWFSDRDRVSGRDLLSTWGLAPKNKETGLRGWIDDPLEAAWDIGGFLTETALDPLNMLSRPAKVIGTAADTLRPSRGLAANLLDPLRLSEAGEKLGVRSVLDETGKRIPGREGLLRKGVSATGKVASRAAKAVDKAPVVGDPFRILRSATGEAADALRRNSAAMFDASVQGTTRKVIQPIMRAFWRRATDSEDLIQIEAMGLDSRLRSAITSDSDLGPEFLEKLREGTAAVESRTIEAVDAGRSLEEPVRAKMQELGYSDDEISGKLNEFRSITSDAQRLGRQMQPLSDWWKKLEQEHAGRSESAIPDPSAIPEFTSWRSGKGGPIPSEVVSRLGWRKSGQDYVNDTVGFQVGTLSNSGNYWIRSRDGEMLPENFRSLGDAIQFVHSKARDSARELSIMAFDDSDRFLEMFQEHDLSTREMLDNAIPPSSMTDLDLYEEVSAAALGLPPGQFDYRILKPDVRQMIRETVPPESSLILDLEARGWPTGEVDDPAGLPFVARRLSDVSKARYRAVRGRKGEGFLQKSPDKLVDAPSPATTSRSDIYLGWPGGAPQINRFFRDPELAEGIDTVVRNNQSGAYTGMATQADAGNILDTLRDVDPDLSKQVMDFMASGGGTFSPDGMAREVRDVADRLEESGAGMRWAIGGWGRKSHVLDDLLAETSGGRFQTVKLQREANESDGIAQSVLTKNGLTQPQTDPEFYQIARDEVSSALRGRPDADLDDAIKLINSAERDGVPVFFRTATDESGSRAISGVLVPQTRSTIASRLRTQAKNLKKKVPRDRQLSDESLRELQQESVLKFIRGRYGDVIDPIPLRTDSGLRRVVDHRSGVPVERNISDSEYDGLSADGLITQSPEEASARGSVQELTESRHEKLAAHVLSQDGGYSAHRHSGVFTNDPVLDRLSYRLSVQRAVLQADAFDSLVDHFVSRAGNDPTLVYKPLMESADETAENSLGSLLGSLKTKNGLSPNRYLKYVARKKNPSLLALDRPEGLSRDAVRDLAKLEEAEVDWLRRIQIDTEDFIELSEGLNLSKESLADMPGLGGTAVKFADAATQLFKVGVLAFPARIARDLISAAYRSFESGVVKPDGKGLNSLKMGNAVATGRITEGFTDLLKSADFVERFNASHYASLHKEGHLGLNEAVFDFFRDTFYVKQGGAYHYTAMDIDDSLSDIRSAGSLDTLRESVPNRSRKPLSEQARRLGGEILDDGSSAMNPLNLKGMRRFFTKNEKLRGSPRPRSQFVLDRLANIAGGWSDASTRAAAVIDQMRRGSDFRSSFSRTAEALVSYDRRRFSQFEREIMKRVFPFYSFMSSQLPYVFKELATDPAGGLGRTVRAQRLSQDQEYVPHHMRDRAAVPLGETEAGDQNYISSLGLMHEDALAMANPQLSDVLGDMNPLLKVPVELATGRSLFMRGPLGGEDLSELDPTVGRIRQNLGERLGLREPSRSRPEPFISNTIEHVLSNSPVSRWLNSTRTLLDDRKTPGQIALNLLTGVKVTTVSPEQQQRMLRDEADAILKDRGIRPFTRYHLKPGEIDEIEKSGDEDTARRLRAVERVRQILDKARRQRAKSASTSP